MALKPGLRVSLNQRLALTPALRQSISVLRMSSGEIDELIETELVENPLLQGESENRSGSGGDFQFALDTVAREKSLAEDLRDQISVMNAPEPILQIACYLARDLTEDGFLAEDDLALTEALGCEIDEIHQAINLLQSCDPVGIGARDLGECLGIQLRAAGEKPAEVSAVLENLSEFAEQNWLALYRKTGKQYAELQRLGELLRGLNPYPAHSFSSDAIPALRPDVQVVAKPESGFSIELVGSVRSGLHVNRDLLKSAHSGDAKTSTYAIEHAARADSLIRAIEARSKTILRVGREIVSIQHRFFVQGPDHLVPLTQAELADRMGLHPSTINRTIANKSLACSFGVFQLKFFFSPTLGSLSGGTGRSSYVVQQQIRRLILQESPSETLTDEQITSSLRESGVDIARRTVAKYRQCLKIPSSAQRRKSKRFL